MCPGLPGRQPEAAMIVRLVVHQADHADQRLGRGLLADRPCPAGRAPWRAGPGSRRSGARRRADRARNLVGQVAHHFPIAETGAGWRRRPARQRAQDQAGCAGRGADWRADMGRAGVAPGAACNGGNATARIAGGKRGAGEMYIDGLSDASARPSRHWRKTVNTPTKTSAWRFSATSRTWRWACAIPATRSSTSGRCWNACCSGQHRGQEGLLRLGALQEFKAPCTRPISS